MEEPILKESLLAIKRRLTDLRQDRTRFLTPAHIAELYAEFGETVKGKGPLELEAVQPLLNEVILMFSLALVTVGYTKYMPATYAITVTMRTILGYLSKDPALTPKELDLLHGAFNTMQRIASSDLDLSSNEDDEDAEICDVPEVDLIVRKALSETKLLYDQSEEILSHLREEEWPLYIQAIRLRRDILSTVTAQESSLERMPALGEKYLKIKALADHTDAGNHSEPLRLQIENCHKFYEWYSKGVRVDDWDSDSDLSRTYRQLQESVSTLEVFVMTRRWTLRGTDLYQHIKGLSQLTPWLGERAQGSSPTARLWFLCLYMARRCWTLIFRLLNNLEPVSEALASVYNQVVTMKRCLNEVHLAGGINNVRELYPFQMKLASLDNLRDDGKFTVNGDVPPGQGILNGMLAECYDLMYELKVELEEKIDQGELDEDDSLLVDDGDDDNDDEDDGSDDATHDAPTQNKEMPVISIDGDTPAETPADTPEVTPVNSRNESSIPAAE